MVPVHHWPVGGYSYFMYVVFGVDDDLGFLMALGLYDEVLSPLLLMDMDMFLLEIVGILCEGVSCPLNLLGTVGHTSVNLVHAFLYRHCVHQRLCCPIP